MGRFVLSVRSKPVQATVRQVHLAPQPAYDQELSSLLSNVIASRIDGVTDTLIWPGGFVADGLGANLVVSALMNLLINT